MRTKEMSRIRCKHCGQYYQFAWGVCTVCGYSLMNEGVRYDLKTGKQIIEKKGK